MLQSVDAEYDHDPEMIPVSVFFRPENWACKLTEQNVGETPSIRSTR